MVGESGGGWPRISAGQFGVLSRAQALACGLSRHDIAGLLRRGLWVHALPSVYRCAAAPVEWPQAAMAASLWADGRAVVSHRAAAALWEFEGFWRSRVELCGTTGLSAPAGVTFHRVRRLARSDLSRRRGIPVTGVARTLLDLAAVVPDLTLQRALDEALRRELVSIAQLEGCLARNGRRGREGAARLEALLGDRAQHGATDSGLETKVVAALRRARLPAPTRQYPVVENDTFLARVDLAWPRRRVAIQVHSPGFHRQLRTWEKDQVTENQLLAGGWRVVKVTPQMLRAHEAQVVELVRGALATRR